MGITIPEFHLKSKIDLVETRNRLKGGRRARDINAELTLTSLIDMFSVVILFLIQSFSATGEIFMVNKDVTLPQAYHARLLERAPIVTVMADKVTVEGLVVGDNTGITEKIEETDWDLPLLRSKLEEYRNFARSIAPDVPFKGEVIIQADVGLEFIYLKRVMFTLAQLGFNGINLAVRGEVTNKAPEEGSSDQVPPEAATTKPQ